MASYHLTLKAVDDLKIIWEYTFENWSEKQADYYYTTLIETCELIANSPQIGKNYEGIVKSLFGLSINHHIIFYRQISDDNVEIIRILHERMDLIKNIEK
jgi:toxin ParE1/3/4